MRGTINSALVEFEDGYRVVGWLPGRHGERAYVDERPVRLQVQASLEMAA